ncbi:MAG TPA: hypothetical protein VEH76_13085 [Methylocystis sp.]|nr:hypothetical protein [Methylocystis sp.]
MSFLSVELKGWETSAHDATLRLLPRSVRLVSPTSRLEAPASPEDLCEFEVVAGNAAYKQGEHFYLRRSKALRAYGDTDAL